MRDIRIVKRQQLNYMNAYNAVLEVEGFGTLNVLVSYCTPVLVSDGEVLIALKDATCSATTRRHVGVWLRRFAPSYSYQDIKKTLENNHYSTTIVGACCTARTGWLYDILCAIMPLTPCKRFCNGLFYIERGEGAWSRLTC